MASGSPTIRAVAESDYAQVVAVLIEAYTTEWGPNGWAEYRSEMERVEERSQNTLVVVAVRGERVVGTVTVVPPSSPLRSIGDHNAAEVRLLAVAPSERRKGVAAQLIARAGASAREIGLGSLVLQCDEDLESAHRLYLRLGFTREPAHDTEVEGGYRALGYSLVLSSS